MLREIIAPEYSSGQTGFTYADIANVKIINESKSALTRFWMQKGAITLGPVVVLTDGDYNQLMNAANATDLYGLLMGQSGRDFSNALIVLLHEMVHVNQYAEQGRETFATNYLLKNAPLVTDGYGSCEYEQEAYKFEASIAEYLGGEFCNHVKWRVDSEISSFLDRQPLFCLSLKDSDQDRHYDHLDNCPLTANPDQRDEDGNRIGDVCDYHAWLPVLLSIF